MMKVPLKTRFGDHVCTVTVPPMTPAPEVIMWGQRIFIRQGEDKDPNAIPEYREGLAWFCPPGTTDPKEFDPWRTVADGKPDGE